MINYECMVDSVMDYAKEDNVGSTGLELMTLS